MQLSQSILDAIAVPIDWRFGVILLAVILAGFLRGFVGFGAALVSIPVISLVFGPRAAVVIVTVMGLPSTLQLFPDALRHSERAIVLPIAIAVFAAAPIGTWVLVSVSPALMKIVISGLVIAMVAFLAVGWKLKQQVNQGLLLFAGTVGGLIQGAAGIGGPPVVAVALSREGPPERQRANVLAVMTAVVLSSLPPLYYYDLFTRQSVVSGLLLVVPYALATQLGSRYFSGAGRAHFRNAALVVLAIIALTTLIFAVRDYLGP